MTTVSLLIPVFNHAAYLEAALQSVFSQTRPPDEIILVDDGSTDNSAEVARRHIDRVTLISQENQGISGARNTALAASKGDVVTFLDADDLWPKDSLAVRLERLADAPRVECVFGLSEQFFSEDLPPETRAKLFCPPGQVGARFAGAMVARRAVFDRVGPFASALKVGETMDWLARANEAGVPMDTVQALVMRRRIHGANTVLRERASHGDYLRVLKASLDRKAAAGRGV